MPVPELPFAAIDGNLNQARERISGRFDAGYGIAVTRMKLTSNRQRARTRFRVVRWYRSDTARDIAIRALEQRAGQTGLVYLRIYR